jgi:small conductance mechanosensitive channel
VNIVLYLVLFYVVIAYLGVNTSLFVAMFAAAGLAIGMALSGVFQNFAGGVMILLLKPFKVGDWIVAQGESGTVMDIRLFNTVLRTADNQTILLPNGALSTSIVQNTNAAKTRRVEWIISLSYGDDADSALAVMTEMVKADPRVLSSPAPIVHFGNLGASAIEFKVWAWVKSSDYWDVFYHFNAEFYRVLPTKGFNFPFSTLTVHIDEQK